MEISQPLWAPPRAWLCLLTHEAVEDTDRSPQRCLQAEQTQLPQRLFIHGMLQAPNHLGVPLTILVSPHWSLASWSMACQSIYVKQECKPGHRSGSFRAGVWSFVVRRGLTFLQMFQVPPFEVLQVLYSAGCIQTALLNLYGHTRTFTGSKLILICASAMHIAWGSSG